MSVTITEPTDRHINETFAAFLMCHNIAVSDLRGEKIQNGITLYEEVKGRKQNTTDYFLSHSQALHFMHFSNCTDFIF